MIPSPFSLCFSHPKPFKYIIRPRDGQAIALINTTIDEHPIEKGHADELQALFDKL